jgi:hypothetical protein
MSDRKPIRFEMRLPAELADHIDEWRRDVPALPARADAARRLIEFGLAAYEYTQAVPGTPLEQAKSKMLGALGRARTAPEE